MSNIDRLLQRVEYWEREVKNGELAMRRQRNSVLWSVVNTVAMLVLTAAMFAHGHWWAVATPAVAAAGFAIAGAIVLSVRKEEREALEEAREQLARCRARLEAR